MLIPTTESQDRQIECLLSKMSDEDFLAHVLCWQVPDKAQDDEICATLEKVPFGSVFVGYASKQRLEEITSLIRRVSKYPVVVCADLENGPGARIEGATNFPWALACGATNNPQLARLMGECTAKEGRSVGVHWTFSPVVDLNINPRNGMSSIRSFGEKPGHVLAMTKAYIQGVQSAGLMAATAKHFPGDGLDDRDVHICTSLNHLSRDEWEESYGRVWRGVIDEGVMTIMSGHIGMPCIDRGIKSHLGPTPASLSKKIQSEFLRGELGFQGVVVSDAITMPGFSSHTGLSSRAVDNIASGSDVTLWANTGDYNHMLQAVRDKKFDVERAREATKRILQLKARLGLLEEREVPTVTTDDTRRFLQCSEDIGESSITVVRNEGALLPLKLKPGAKLLTISCQFEEYLRGFVQELEVIDEELRKRGYEVDHIKNLPGKKLFGSGREIYDIMHNYDAIFVNVHVLPRYGSLFFTDKISRLFWDSFWTEHPCVIFTSLGDPYKIYEMPYVPNMVNTYGSSPSSQRAVVKVWLGELAARGKTPVSLDGFFECEV